MSTANTIETFEASNFADKYETYSEAIQDNEWNTFQVKEIKYLKSLKVEK